MLIHVTQAEVHDLETPIKVEQQVLGFQISVANAQLMNVVHASHQFLEVLAGLLFLQALILNDQFKKFPT